MDMDLAEFLRSLQVQVVIIPLGIGISGFFVMRPRLCCIATQTLQEGA